MENPLDIFEKRDIPGHAAKVGAYLAQKLDELAGRHDQILERRGIGLMQGLEFSVPVGEILGRCLEKGLILINAGEKIIRFVPPLVITEADVDEMIRILEDAL